MRTWFYPSTDTWTLLSFPFLLLNVHFQTTGQLKDNVAGLSELHQAVLKSDAQQLAQNMEKDSIDVTDNVGVSNCFFFLLFLIYFPMFLLQALIHQTIILVPAMWLNVSSYQQAEITMVSSIPWLLHWKLHFGWLDLLVAVAGHVCRLVWIPPKLNLLQ